MKVRMGRHDHRSPLSFLLPKCRLPCLRRYTDSEPGSDIQQDSLLDNELQANCWHDHDYVNISRWQNASTAVSGAAATDACTPASNQHSTSVHQANAAEMDASDASGAVEDWCSSAELDDISAAASAYQESARSGETASRLQYDRPQDLTLLENSPIREAAPVERQTQSELDNFDSSPWDGHSRPDFSQGNISPSRTFHIPSFVFSGTQQYQDKLCQDAGAASADEGGLSSNCDQRDASLSNNLHVRDTTSGGLSSTASSSDSVPNPVTSDGFSNRAGLQGTAEAMFAALFEPPSSYETGNRLLTDRDSFNENVLSDQEITNVCSTTTSTDTHSSHIRPNRFSSDALSCDNTDDTAIIPQPNHTNTSPNPLGDLRFNFARQFRMTQPVLGWGLQGALSGHASGSGMERTNFRLERPGTNLQSHHPVTAQLANPERRESVGTNHENPLSQTLHRDSGSSSNSSTMTRSSTVRSTSSGSSLGWYVYDQRFAPPRPTRDQRQLQRQQRQKNERGTIISPPSYDDISPVPPIAEDPPNWTFSAHPEEEDLPPPYTEEPPANYPEREPPPNYSEALHHVPAAFGITFTGDIFSGDEEQNDFDLNLENSDIFTNNESSTDGVIHNQGEISDLHIVVPSSDRGTPITNNRDINVPDNAAAAAQGDHDDFDLALNELDDEANNTISNTTDHVVGRTDPVGFFTGGRPALRWSRDTRLARWAVSPNWMVH